MFHARTTIDVPQLSLSVPVFHHSRSFSTWIDDKYQIRNVLRFIIYDLIDFFLLSIISVQVIRVSRSISVPVFR